VKKGWKQVLEEKLAHIGQREREDPDIEHQPIFSSDFPAFRTIDVHASGL
jgi:hypothetical protein